MQDSTLADIDYPDFSFLFSKYRPAEPDGGEGEGAAASQILAKADLLPIDNNSEK